MKKDLICIICPRGCSLQVDISGEKPIVTGNACPKGEKYGVDECTNPKRTVTSVMRVADREDTMVSVKTSTPVKKGDIFSVMERIRAASVKAPVNIDDVIIKDAFGADIIATKQVK